MNDWPLFQPVRRTRAYEVIVEQVEEAIRNGGLLPGDRLPSERELMTQFAVGRSTVREALRVLESNGLVGSANGERRGAEVLAFSTTALMKSIQSLLQLERLTLSDLVFFRMLVEGAVSGLAAMLRDESDLTKLSDCLDEMRRAVDAGDQVFSKSDVSFHEAISEIAGNRLLTACNHVVSASVRNLISQRIASGPRKHEQMNEAVTRHVALYEAIQRGDPIAACRVSRTNLYEYYRVHVDETDQRKLKSLLEQASS